MEDNNICPIVIAADSQGNTTTATINIVVMDPPAVSIVVVQSAAVFIADTRYTAFAVISLGGGARARDGNGYASGYQGAYGVVLPNLPPLIRHTQPTVTDNNAPQLFTLDYTPWNTGDLPLAATDNTARIAYTARDNNPTFGAFFNHFFHYSVVAKLDNAAATLAELVIDGVYPAAGEGYGTTQTGGTPNYQFAADSDRPAYINLQQSGAALSLTYTGSPRTADDGTFEITVTDSGTGDLRQTTVRTAIYRVAAAPPLTLAFTGGDTDFDLNPPANAGNINIATLMAMGGHLPQGLEVIQAESDPDFSIASGTSVLVYNADAGENSTVTALVRVRDNRQRADNSYYWATTGVTLELAIQTDLGASGPGLVPVNRTDMTLATVSFTDPSRPLTLAAFNSPFPNVSLRANVNVGGVITGDDIEIIAPVGFGFAENYGNTNPPRIHKVTVIAADARNRVTVLVSLSMQIAPLSIGDINVPNRRFNTGRGHTILVEMEGFVSGPAPQGRSTYISNDGVDLDGVVITLDGFHNNNGRATIIASASVGVNAVQDFTVFNTTRFDEAGPYSAYVDSAQRVFQITFFTPQPVSASLSRTQFPSGYNFSGPGHITAWVVGGDPATHYDSFFVSPYATGTGCRNLSGGRNHNENNRDNAVMNNFGSANCPDGVHILNVQVQFGSNIRNFALPITVGTPPPPPVTVAMLIGGGPNANMVNNSVVFTMDAALLATDPPNATNAWVEHTTLGAGIKQAAVSYGSGTIVIFGGERTDSSGNVLGTLAAGNFPGRGGVIYSADRGTSWVTVRNIFQHQGGVFNGRFYDTQLVAHQGTVYMVGGRYQDGGGNIGGTRHLGRSTNGGATWETVNQFFGADNGLFGVAAPYGRDIVYYTGEWHNHQGTALWRINFADVNNIAREANIAMADNVMRRRITGNNPRSVCGGLVNYDGTLYHIPGSSNDGASADTCAGGGALSTALNKIYQSQPGSDNNTPAEAWLDRGAPLFRTLFPAVFAHEGNIYYTHGRAADVKRIARIPATGDATARGTETNWQLPPQAHHAAQILIVPLQ